MSTQTNNYGLVKPEAQDFVDIEVLNGNMDKVDAALKNKYGADNKPDPADIGAVKNYGLIGEESELDIFEWAKAQTTSGTFMVGGHVTSLPRVEFFQGLLCAIQRDRFLWLWNNKGAYFTGTTSGEYVDDWKEVATSEKFLPLDGGTLGGSLGVNNGSGRLLSWRTETESGTAMEAHQGTETASLQIVLKDSDIGIHVVHHDTGTGESASYQIMHTGNTPAVVATATLEE